MDVGSADSFFRTNLCEVGQFLHMYKFMLREYNRQLVLYSGLQPKA